MNFLREVCVDKIDDAIKASKLGADRIEFCSKLDDNSNELIDEGIRKEG